MVRDHRDLRVWRASFDLAMDVLRLARAFPPSERFLLTHQVVRSSRSACANIAEAWRKRRYPAAFVAKLSDAEAEVAETRCHLDFACACGYVEAQIARDLDARYSAVSGQLVRMISRPAHWTVERGTGRKTGERRRPPTEQVGPRNGPAGPRKGPARRWEPGDPHGRVPSSPRPPSGGEVQDESPDPDEARDRPPIGRPPARPNGARKKDRR